MFFCLALIVLVSFFIIDSIISYNIVKDIEKYRDEFYDMLVDKTLGLNKKISEIKDLLESIKQSKKRAYRPRRSIKKNEEKRSGDTQS